MTQKTKGCDLPRLFLSGLDALLNNSGKITSIQRSIIYAEMNEHIKWFYKEF